VSEIFPMEIRAMCIALFYAVGTGLGGIIGPVLFSSLAASGREENVALGYYIGAGVMIVAGLAELLLGVEAAGRSLEDVAPPLSAQTAGGRSGQHAETDGRPSGRPTLAARSYNQAPLLDDPERDRELGAILEALRNGPLPPEELGERVGADAWTPGRLAEVLRYGLAMGTLVDDGPDGAVRARFQD
jgi:MFS family permease